MIFLVDMLGRVVHVWHTDPDRIARAWFLRRLPNGNWLGLNAYAPHTPEGSAPVLIPSLFREGTHKSQILELNWRGDAVWRYKVPDKWLATHDMARLENGNTLLVMDEKVTNPSVSDKLFADNLFVEVDPSGEILWQWSTGDHIEEFGYSDACRHLMYAKGGDIFHTNTCSPLPGNPLEKTDVRFAKGNILSSQRDVNLIYILDRKSERVVWTWGDKPGQLVGQHHPIMLDNGNILIYDNGGQGGYPPRCRFYTRLIEIDPISGEIVWQYAHDESVTFKPMSKFFSSSWGSVQRLPNGNTLSLDCHKGRLFEVTPWGELVWEYISPFAWGRGVAVKEPGIYRTYRYSYEDVPQVDPWFGNTDGHIGTQPVQVELPKGLGLPATDLA
jgi:outer membrane protein assembly factor BamB